MSTDIGSEAVKISETLKRIAVSLEEISFNLKQNTEIETVRIGEPNSAGWSMLVGVTHDLSISLKNILDDPNLNQMEKAQELRIIVAVVEKMQKNYQEKLYQIRNVAHGDSR